MAKHLKAAGRAGQEFTPWERWRLAGLFFFCTVDQADFCETRIYMGLT
jgi:hypothetical protein